MRQLLSVVRNSHWLGKSVLQRPLFQLCAPFIDRSHAASICASLRGCWILLWCLALRPDSRSATHHNWDCIARTRTKQGARLFTWLAIPGASVDEAHSCNSCQCNPSCVLAFYSASAGATHFRRFQLPRFVRCCQKGYWVRYRFALPTRYRG